MSENIIEGIQRQCRRVRNTVIPAYEEIGVPGAIAAAMIRRSVEQAEAAIASGDVLAMIAAYKDLEGYES